MLNNATEQQNLQHYIQSEIGRKTISKIKIPDFAKGTVVEMCMKVADLAKTEESKQIWAATAIYA